MWQYAINHHDQDALHYIRCLYPRHSILPLITEKLPAYIFGGRKKICIYRHFYITAAKHLFLGTLKGAGKDFWWQISEMPLISVTGSSEKYLYFHFDTLF
jgi:hypothetical protein